MHHDESMRPYGARLVDELPPIEDTAERLLIRLELARTAIEAATQYEIGVECRRIFADVLHTPGGKYLDDGSIDHADPQPIDLESERAIVSFTLTGSEVPSTVLGRVTMATDGSYVLLDHKKTFDRDAEGYGGQRNEVLQAQLASLVCCVVETEYGKVWSWPQGARRNAGITESGLFDTSSEANDALAFIFNGWQARGRRGQPMTMQEKGDLMVCILGIRSFNTPENNFTATIDVPDPPNGMMAEVRLWKGNPLVPDAVLLQRFIRQVLPSV